MTSGLESSKKIFKELVGDETLFFYPYKYDFSKAWYKTVVISKFMEEDEDKKSVVKKEEKAVNKIFFNTKILEELKGSQLVFQKEIEPLKQSVNVNKYINIDFSPRSLIFHAANILETQLEYILIDYIVQPFEDSEDMHYPLKHTFVSCELANEILFIFKDGLTFDKKIEYVGKLKLIPSELQNKELVFEPFKVLNEIRQSRNRAAHELDEEKIEYYTGKKSKKTPKDKGFLGFPEVKEKLILDTKILFYILQNQEIFYGGFTHRVGKDWLSVPGLYYIFDHYVDKSRRIGEKLKQKQLEPDTSFSDEYYEIDYIDSIEKKRKTRLTKMSKLKKRLEQEYKMCKDEPSPEGYTTMTPTDIIDSITPKYYKTGDIFKGFKLNF